MQIFPLFGYRRLLLTAKPIAKSGFPDVRLGELGASVILIRGTIDIITAAPLLLENDALPEGFVKNGQGEIGSLGLKAFGFMK